MYVVEDKEIIVKVVTAFVESSDDGKYYKVVAHTKDDCCSCSCPHYKYRGVICKHIIKVRLEEGI